MFCLIQNALVSATYFLLVYVRGVCLLILLYTQVCRLCGCEWDMRGIVAERQDDIV
jgi:hypothetical protein